MVNSFTSQSESDLTPDLPDPVPMDSPARAHDPVSNVAQPTVRDLLALSRSAHLQYHQHLPRMADVRGAGAQVQPGDGAEARRALKLAASLRAQAEIMDPEHLDLSWADEAATYPSRSLLVFYLQQLAK